MEREKAIRGGSELKNIFNGWMLVQPFRFNDWSEQDSDATLALSH